MFNYLSLLLVINLVS